jgi:hypothetical protein
MFTNSMGTSFTIEQIVLIIGSIVLVFCATLVIKYILHGIKRPNSRKGGIISLHAAVAFAIVTSIAIVTQDWILVSLAVLLAFLISKGKLDTSQNYIYQIIISCIVGVGIPIGLFYLNDRRHQNMPSERDTFENKPEKARDDRHEADSAPELRLDSP